MNQSNKNKSVAIWSVVILVLAAVSYGFFRYASKSSNALSPAVVLEKTVSKSIYKDGTYSALGDYFSPGGSEKITVKMVLKEDVIVDVTTEADKPTGATAERYQKVFINNFKQFVVGKKIDEINLDKVSGSSLTPKGFNDALVKIKIEAKA